MKDFFKDFGGIKRFETGESTSPYKEFALYTFSRVQMSMDEFLKFLGFKTRSVMDRRVRDVSTGLIADLIYHGTLDLFASWIYQKDSKEKYSLLFEWFIPSERPHYFKYQRAYFVILALLYDILNDPLLKKFKDIKNTQSIGPSSPLKTAFQNALKLNRSNFLSALNEYCKNKIHRSDRFSSNLETYSMISRIIIARTAM